MGWERVEKGVAEREEWRFICRWRREKARWLLVCVEGLFGTTSVGEVHGSDMDMDVDVDLRGTDLGG